MQRTPVENFYIQKRQHFSDLNMENEGSLPYKPKATVLYYTETVKCKLIFSYLSKIHFNIFFLCWLIPV
jgi:hypothetical protein